MIYRGKALSVAQPWASAIAYAGKDVENRSWRTHYRGPVAIHASGSLRKGDVDDLVRQVRGGPRRRLMEWIRKGQRRVGLANDDQEIVQSHILAIAMIVDCVERSSSPWHYPDSWGWVLEGVVPIEPVPMKGTLGLWECKFYYAPLSVR